MSVVVLVVVLVVVMVVVRLCGRKFRQQIGTIYTHTDVRIDRNSQAVSLTCNIHDSDIFQKV